MLAGRITPLALLALAGGMAGPAVAQDAPLLNPAAPNSSMTGRMPVGSPASPVVSPGDPADGPPCGPCHEVTCAPAPCPPLSCATACAPAQRLRVIIPPPEVVFR